MRNIYLVCNSSLIYVKFKPYMCIRIRLKTKLIFCLLYKLFELLRNLIVYMCVYKYLVKNKIDFLFDLRICLSLINLVLCVSIRNRLKIKLIFCLIYVFVLAIENLNLMLYYENVSSDLG